MTTRNGFGEGSATIALLPTDPLMARNPRAGEVSGTWHTDIINLAGSIDTGYSADISSTVNGVLSSYADTLLFGRLWIDPIDIDKGLIVAASTTAVSIWNAYQSVNKPFSSISVISPGGTTIVNPTPYNLHPTAVIDVNITVLRAGPTVQYTTYGFDIDAVIYPIIVRGTRAAITSTGNILFGLGL